MPGRRTVIAIALVALLCLIEAAGASACSCARRSASASLHDADAALVGRLLGVEARGPARAAYRYRVVRLYRGDESIRPGGVLTVLSGRSAAACALPTRVGRRYGLLLAGGEGRWAGGICGVLSPRRLWLAAQRTGPGGGAEASAAASPAPGSAPSACA